MEKPRELDKLKKFLIYQILNFLPSRVYKQFRIIKNRKYFTYFIEKRRVELINAKKKITRELLLKKKEEERKNLELMLESNKKVKNKIRMKMLIFRSATINEQKFNDENENPILNTDLEDLMKVKELIKHNQNDIVNIRHTQKQLNGAFLPELVYNSDSEIQISRSELIRILKLENKLRLSENSKKRNDYFFGHRLMSEIDQDHIEEALLFFGYIPSKDDSLKAYHLACGKYINDPEIKELVVWMKYDKMRKSPILQGQPPILEGIEIYNLANQPIPLKNLLVENKPNVIVCGSYS